MNCETLAAHLTDFLEGELSADDEAAALEHLSTCHACEVVLADTRDVVALASEHGRVPLTDEDRSRMLGTVISQLTD